MNSRSKTSKSSHTINASAVDLFCGAGGLTRGLLDAGIPVVAGYDLDPICKFPYEHNNSVHFEKQSVVDVTSAMLNKHFPDGHIKILVGCAPCQTFSRYTQGLSNHDDPQWELLDEFRRLVEELKPDIVSMENVPDLQRHDIFDRFIETLADEHFNFIGDPNEQIVHCPDYGIPQQRRRLVLVASRLGPIKLIPPTHTGSRKRNVRQALSGLPRLSAGQIDPNDPLHRSSSLSEINLRRIRQSKPGGTWRDWPSEMVAACHRGKKGKTYPSVYGRMTWDQPSPTITTQFYGFGNGRFGHPQQDRALSLREGAILQSFPKSYQFVESGGTYSFKTIGRLIGNAVPVRLGEIIGRTIKLHLEQYGRG